MTASTPAQGQGSEGVINVDVALHDRGHFLLQSHLEEVVDLIGGFLETYV
jgi:hypothetical protein